VQRFNDGVVFHVSKNRRERCRIFPRLLGFCCIAMRGIRVACFNFGPSDRNCRTAIPKSDTSRAKFKSHFL
jgi:hypothetical protein